MLKLIYNTFKKDFARFYEQEKPGNNFDFSMLEKRLTDSNGMAYYGVPNGVALPVERFGKMMEFMNLMSAGISGEEFDKMIEAGETALEEGLKKGKAAGKIGFLFEVMKDRRNMILHTEILYNFLAVQLIREDENPFLYSPEIQMQKVEQFKKEVEGGKSYPFFQVPELSILNDRLRLSEQEWETFWAESKVKQEALSKVLENLKR